MTKKNFTVIIEKDEDDFYIATVPELKSCYTQAKSIEELIPRIREVIQLCIDVQGYEMLSEKVFVGVQQIEVAL
ncbi:MAG TPA: type II toxin-antitoxin system HicB family antitoxin [Spirochaetota bacterium]|jgi:predicted RNase H-like HicB family nuclease|nr:MAG: hypothetical protein BWX91_01399 [Spirochaetes bacterium ADurb.Bin133]HNZ25741.1 type II toxin-antitoxin system HicB family antitoxin [Spirochaetota bacterium]HPY87218.1 type II toxin-antitoxin system HicB family antitoxin [Spirochaetota bacterium]HQB62214.1 type II toxin-antitoxin system HicB family antitoxin [Spirochaetota bacterium]